MSSGTISGAARFSVCPARPAIPWSMALRAKSIQSMPSSSICRIEASPSSVGTTRAQANSSRNSTIIPAMVSSAFAAPAQRTLIEMAREASNCLLHGLGRLALFEQVGDFAYAPFPVDERQDAGVVVAVYFHTF